MAVLRLHWLAISLVSLPLRCQKWETDRQLGQNIAPDPQQTETRISIGIATAIDLVETYP
jgi:hypothetical protein